MEEQKNAKKYEELNRYEKAMANASIEQRLEGLAKEVQQMALALKISVHVDATFHDWDDKKFASADVSFIKVNNCTHREVKETGDLFGIIEEALAKETPAE